MTIEPPQGSNTKNPICAGEDASGPCIPWLYGDHIKPLGSYCKICWNTFKFGGFVDEFGTLTKFRKEIKLKPILLDEFRAARGVYLKLLNTNQIKMRVRGSSADSLSNELQDCQPLPLPPQIRLRSCRSVAIIIAGFITISRFAN